MQQIQQAGDHTWIVGSRYHFGDYDTINWPSLTPGTVAPQGGESESERINAYAYWQWQLMLSLQLIGGASYDWLKYPRNFRFAPLLDPEEDTVDQFSPKGGVIWTPSGSTTIRAGYAQSLGGVSFDQSFQLEPTQVAGFNQAWRSMIPESVAGANSGAQFENWGVSWEQKFETGTYLGLSYYDMNSEVNRYVGTYEFFVPPTFVARNTPQSLDFQERTLVFSLNQLLNAEWSLGIQYKWSRASLGTDLTQFSTLGVLPVSDFAPQQDFESDLHQVDLHVLYKHPSGFFAHVESVFYDQSNFSSGVEQPGDCFWQFHAYAGYRFARRKAELRLGLLNITDQDYRLNPLNLTAELPRDRTLALSFRFNF